MSCRSREILPWMAPHRTPDCWGSLADSPSEVQFTITTTANPRRVRGAIAARGAPAIVGILVLALVVAGAGVVVAVGALHGRSSAAPVAAAHMVAPRPVEQAYRYPLGCLSVMIAATEHGHALAGLDHAGPCWRYGVFITVIFHRVDGVWMMGLEARSASCPPRSLPTLVRAHLADCRSISRGAH